jgi:hypothetical protein
MSVNNSYPELPEIPYKKTSVQMPDIVIFAKTLIGKYKLETVRMAYAIFRNESANGSRGVNNNYAGIQADVGRWKNIPGTPIATCTKVDSGGMNRRFLCFDTDGYKICFELLCIKIENRDMKTTDDYFAKWVGNPGVSQEHKKNFQLLLNAASKAL